MKTPPPVLTPFVRSDAVGTLLAETLGHPGEEATLSELARRTGVALPVVHREVSRLVDAGVLTDRTEGRNRLVSANAEHTLFPLMRDLIDATYGPVPVIREALAGLAGVEQAFIYGSWAARRAGQNGPFPNDIDVLVLGETSRRELADAAAQANERIGLPVNITRLTPDEWANDATPFVRTVRGRPYVDVMTGEIHG